MIGRAYSYTGSPTDVRRLNAHLWKNEGQTSRLVSSRNLCAHNTVDGMAVMAALTAGSQAQIAFWHFYVSPSRTLSESESLTVVDLVIHEFGAEDHPLMVWIHDDKPRARRGGGANHIHFVLGHVSPLSFKALNMRQHAPRIHKTMAVGSYNLGELPVASPWHKSIVATLRAEGRTQVADWLIDMLGEAPVIGAPRLTDSMRRSAQAALFPLTEFHAGLERLWDNGATPTEISVFLNESNVTIDCDADVIKFHCGTLFVGALHRILQRDLSSVTQEARRRIPALLTSPQRGDLLKAEQSGDSQASSRLQVDKQSKAARQRKIDVIEERLAGLRLERLSLIYDRDRIADGSRPAQGADLGPDVDALAPKSVASGGAVDRIARLAKAEKILEIAVSLLWIENSSTMSDVELMRRAKRIAVGRAPEKERDHGAMPILQQASR